MFNTLHSKIEAAFSRIRGRGKLSEADIDEAIQSMCRLNRVMDLLSPDLLEQIHAATAVRYASTLSKVLEHAKRSGWVTVNAVRESRKPRVPCPMREFAAETVRITSEVSTRSRK